MQKSFTTKLARIAKLRLEPTLLTKSFVQFVVNTWRHERMDTGTLPARDITTSRLTGSIIWNIGS